MDWDELMVQNPWWKEAHAIEQDYDIVRWREKKWHWIPKLVKEIELTPFALHAITGPRQCGKSTILKLVIQKLISEKYEPKSIFYFNCENLSDHKELYEVLQQYLEFRTASGISKSIIILDEITSPKEWYHAIKAGIDQGLFRNDVIIVTGSSSMEVKRHVELFPGRRGTGKDYRVLPLTFREFLEVRRPDLCKKISTTQSLENIEQKACAALPFQKELDKELMEYLKIGGFPLSVSQPEENKIDAKKAYLSWIKNAILKEERNDLIARQILKVILETGQTAISWENTSRQTEIKSPKTIAAYIDLLKSIFVIQVIYNIDINKKTIQFGKNKKIYILDPLLVEILEDWCLVRVKKKESLLAETLVVNQLNRMYPEQVFFWKNGFEIDAIVLEKGKAYGIEVKWSETPSAKALPQLKKFIIVTKKDFSQKPIQIPLSLFLAVADVS